MLSSLQNILDHNQNSHETKTSSLANPCPFCNKNLAKYLCPRCGTPYCSLTCYRSSAHEDCSEGFYKDEVRRELGGSRADEEERRKMEEVLRKYGVQAPESGGPLEWSGEGVEGPTTLGEGEGDDLGETTRWPEVVDEEDEEDEEDVEEDEGEEEEEEDIIGETLEEQER